jgi:hypothetical protein
MVQMHPNQVSSTFKLVPEGCYDPVFIILHGSDQEADTQRVICGKVKGLKPNCFNR